MSNNVPVLEIVEFTTREGVCVEELRIALEQLEPDLRQAGGFLSQKLYAAADQSHGWLVSYHWATIEDAQLSMERVATTASFAALMKLVANPEAIRLSYGIAA